MMNKNTVTITNLRDLGSLICRDGRVIKSGKIFRSSKLVPKTVADEQYIRALNLDCVIDLRSIAEANEAPDGLPEGVRYSLVPVLREGAYTHIVVTKAAQKLCLKEDKSAADYLHEEKPRSYLEMPFAKDAYNVIFNCMDNGETFLFHCTEGKDRTGVGAALIELALGRTEEQAIAEYLRSNTLRPGKNRKPLRLLGFSQELIEAIAYAEHTHRELLESTFAEMRKAYGSTQNFLKEYYGITQERAKAWHDMYTV